ncbi:MAG: DUF1304 domain-containing protein [Salinisphaeraceae bacterium]|nr:DUF1304 domain-containing protein [Salinisphaeraceae bacterium]
MTITMLALAIFACLFHLLAFVLESCLFMRPQVHKRFGARSTEQAEAARLFAFNQGFYNLFLVIGCVTGIVAWDLGHDLVGSTLVLFTCASMAAAGLVLLISAPNKLSAALMQGLPPALVIILYLL